MYGEFKSFHETYKLIAFALIVGMIYPNPATVKWRLAFTLIFIASVSPVALMILLDMYLCWLERDIVNIIRHSTVLGPFLAVFFKMLLMIYKRQQAERILDEINRDYDRFNNFADDYRSIALASVKNSLKYSERAWVIIITTCVMVFPGMAIVLNTYSYILTFEPEKYMVHDLNKPLSEPKERFESPYFEIMFVYMTYCSILFVVNFIGYDAFFGLSINHACVKIDLFCKTLEDAMRADAEVMQNMVVQVIQEHCRLYRYVGLIQDTFNIWLGLIFLATMIQICTCFYLISEGYVTDLRYMIFTVVTVIHIYVPCHYAAKVKFMSMEAATRFYCSGWESVPDLRIRKLLVFMMARAQIPIEITAFNMITFDMELFMSILRTSYSMFTLLRS